MLSPAPFESTSQHGVLSGPLQELQGHRISRHKVATVCSWVDRKTGTPWLHIVAILGMLMFPKCLRNERNLFFFCVFFSSPASRSSGSHTTSSSFCHLGTRVVLSPVPALLPVFWSVADFTAKLSDSFCHDLWTGRWHQGRRPTSVQLLLYPKSHPFV